MNNLKLFIEMSKNPEPLFDKHYSKLLNEIVIPLTKEEKNELIEKK